MQICMQIGLNMEAGDGPTLNMNAMENYLLSHSLKADRLHLYTIIRISRLVRYRHTDKHLRLLMTTIESTNTKTDGWTDGQTNPMLICAVDKSNNEGYLYISGT